MCLGVIERCLDDSVAYAMDRVQFGKEESEREDGTTLTIDFTEKKQEQASQDAEIKNEEQADTTTVTTAPKKRRRQKAKGALFTCRSKTSATKQKGKGCD